MNYGESSMFLPAILKVLLWFNSIAFAAFISLQKRLVSDNVIALNLRFSTWNHINGLIYLIYLFGHVQPRQAKAIVWSMRWRLQLLPFQNRRDD